MFCCKKTEPQNIRGCKGPLKRSGPSPLPEQDHLELFTHKHVQEGFDCLQRKLPNLSGQPVPVLCHSEKKFSLRSYGNSSAPACISYPLSYRLTWRRGCLHPLDTQLLNDSVNSDHLPDTHLLTDSEFRDKIFSFSFIFHFMQSGLQMSAQNESALLLATTPMNRKLIKQFTQLLQWILTQKFMTQTETAQQE